MPKDVQKAAEPRQRPVSCRFCRTRKLRCSRDVPCSNCVARGLTCDLEDVVRPPAPKSAGFSDAEVLRRLERIERLLSADGGARSPAISTSQERHVEQSFGGQASDSPIPPSQLTCLTPLSPEIQNIDNDVTWLESIYTGQSISLASIPSNNVVFKICPVRDVVGASSFVQPHESVSTQPSRCIWLPQYVEAQAFLKKYMQVASHLPLVTHLASVPSMFDEVYSDITQQRQVKPGYIILMLSIFAGASHSWIHSDREFGLELTFFESLQLAGIWIKSTEDVLDITHRTGNVGLEGLQGILILFYVLANMEGITPRCRSLYSFSIQVARDLGLHRIDHPSNAAAANTVRAEIGRRAWWYLCATDWTMAARFTGISEGVYSCSVRHMITRKPLHINDEDLSDGPLNHLERPLSQPTTMSYSLYRIRLAEISRNMADRIPLCMAATGPLSIDDVWDIDTELQVLLNDVPPYLKMSREQLVESYSLTDARANDFVHQGNIFHFLLHAQRCKLHLPYLTRGFVESTYSSSREVCIRTARLIIQIETRFEESGLSLGIRCKFGGLLVGVFMASIVLLMDLCINRSAPGHAQRRQEVAGAFRILEDMKNESETTARFIDSLVHILRKHKVSPPKPAKTSTAQPANQPYSVQLVPNPQTFGTHNVNSTSKGTMQSNVAIDPANYKMDGIETDVPLVSPEEMSYFNELTQNFDFGVDSANFDWNNILTDLGSSFN